jgi:Domain of unknown function (DUF4249)
MKKILLTLFIVLTFFACKKVINVDLNNADPKLVIEGIIDDNNFTQVSLTKSVKFSNSNNFPAVSGATVTIKDNLGTIYTLTEASAGKYKNAALLGTPGRTYTLTVLAEGKTYSSVSTMPMPVNLDTILTERVVFGTQATWSVAPAYYDPPGFGNYYKFYKSINNKPVPTYWIWDDRFSNDVISTRPLIQTDSIIKLNDSVQVEMQCIDKNIYRYFAALEGTQSGNTVPANPDSNISGGCLGYFSAQTSQKMTVKVQ